MLLLTIKLNCNLKAVPQNNFCVCRNLSVKNLRFLSSEQALADLATFTVAMREKYNFTVIHGSYLKFRWGSFGSLHQSQDNKWVAFGGSYPGSLAAWYRLKYPHLVDIAVSTSAPLVAKLDFKGIFGRWETFNKHANILELTEYLGVVEDAITHTNPTCSDEISKAVKSMEGLLRRRTGWWMIKQHFK